jgi:hypothetical protein
VEGSKPILEGCASSNWGVCNYHWPNSITIIVLLPFIEGLKLDNVLAIGRDTLGGELYPSYLKLFLL